MSSDKYRTLGASATKDGIHDALNNAGISVESEYFAHLVPDIAGDEHYKSFIHADGAGTKSIVSYLRFRESNNPTVFAGLAQDALVMNLDDVYCLGTPSSLVLSNALARNARLVPDSAIEAIVAGYAKLRDVLETQGVSLQLGGGETADCGDVVRTLLVDAVLAGRIAKDKLISPRNIQSGDAIVALSSTGRASYEDNPNSGIGSNGLTLARHALLSAKYAEQYPEIVDPGIDATLAYHGPFSLSDTPGGLEMSIGEALASPTRTYAPILSRVYQTLGNEIHGVIHLTGGAHTKVLRFAEGKRFVKDNLFSTPTLFSLIQKYGQVEWEEMYKVFNMGQRMELYVPKECVEDVCAISQEFSVVAKQVGEVRDSLKSSSEVQIESPHGSFVYSL